MVRLVEEKKIKPVIAKTFPLADARAALEFMEARKHFGKILLIP